MRDCSCGHPAVADDWSMETYFDDFDRAMAETVERLKMAFAEAGYPDAHVYSEWSGIWVEGVPDDVKHRAFDLLNVVDRMRAAAHNAESQP